MENALWNKLDLFSDTLIGADISNCESMWYFFHLMLHNILGRKNIYSYTVSLKYTWEEMNSCYHSKQLLKGILFEEGIIAGNFEDWYYVQCHSIYVATIWK